MHSSGTRPTQCLGFLTVIESAELGLMGGYLLLNAAGRPLEFHCTAPVKPNRTQAILYGPTLKPYLYGEQIGQTLLGQSKLTPAVVCTDCQTMLAVRGFTHIPVVFVCEDDSPQPLDAAFFQLAKSRVVVAPRYRADEEAIREAWPTDADHLDLQEPFLRIREALAEAQGSARQAA